MWFFLLWKEKTHKNCKKKQVNPIGYGDLFLFFTRRKKEKKKLTIYNEIFLFPDRKSSSRYFLFNTYIYIQDVGARKSYPLEDSLFFLFFFEFLIHCQPRETIYDFSLL